MIEQIASNRRDGFPKEPLALSNFVHGIPSGKGARMKEDEVRFVGNWFEAYSALALSCVLDERLRSRFGLDERVLNFWKEFEKSSLNGTASRSDRLNMAEFAKGRRNLVVVYDAVEELRRGAMANVFHVPESRVKELVRLLTDWSREECKLPGAKGYTGCEERMPRSIMKHFGGMQTQEMA